MKKRFMIFLSLLIFIMPLAAGWSQDGVLLHTTEHGTIDGGIYIGGGHGREYTTSYSQNFIVPNGTVKWARLYVSAKEATWINVSLNGHQLDNYTDLINHPKVYANYRTNLGMYWAHYDNAAEWIVNGTNTATANLGTKVGFNTKSWGMALIVVYEGGDNPGLIEYWVSEGNPLLHGDHAPFSAYRNTTDISFTDITDLDNVTGAELWTVYVWGSTENETEQHDTLWFNSDLIAEDPSDGAGTDDQGNNWQGACFDLDHWDVRHSLTYNNTILFDRGEDYILCPTGAILVLKRNSESTSSSRIVNLNTNILPSVSLKVTPDALDFGVLASGQQSSIQLLTINNTGSCSFTVTTDVTDIADVADNLYVDGLLLDSRNWKEYSTSIVKGGVLDVNTVLNVPSSYTGIGTKKGTLIFWAEKT